MNSLSFSVVFVCCFPAENSIAVFPRYDVVKENIRPKFIPINTRPTRMIQPQVANAYMRYPIVQISIPHARDQRKGISLETGPVIRAPINSPKLYMVTAQA